MSYYGFYIIDPLGLIKWGDTSTVAMKVSEWMDPIVKQAGFEFPLVCYPQYIVTPQPHEIIIYVCSYEHSVVQLAPGGKGQIPNPMSSPHKGITLLGPPAASEVYVKESSPIVLASVIFHEAMHNKLQRNNSMHNNFSNPVLSAAMMNITSDIAPTAEESQAMASALAKPVNQWADGQQILWDAAANRKNNDVVWDSQIKYQS